MKNMKKALALVLVFAMLFVVAGCGTKDNGGSGSKANLTAREVADKMIEATGKVDTVQSDITCKININMAMNADGADFSIDMKMDMAMQSIASTDPVAGYFKAEMTMDAMGMNETQISEIYLVEEDGEFVTYTCTDGSWDRTVADEDTQDKLTQSTNYNYLKDMKDEELTLAKKTEKIDGKDAYVLSFTVSGDYLENMGMDLDELMGEGMDISKISYPMTMYIDSETFLPIRSVITITGLSELLNDMMAASMGDMGAEMTIDVKCEDFICDMTYGVEVPALPSEAMGI